MAEGRMLKKKISLNEALANLDNDTHRLLFTWAIPHLDVEGRISGSPRVFKAAVAPLLDHITPAIVLEFFKDAHAKVLLIYYQAGSDWWVEYPKFKDNQTLRENRESPSKIPPPQEAPDKSGLLRDYSGTTPGVIREHSGTTPAEVKLREGKLREEKRRESIASPPPDGGNGDARQTPPAFSCECFEVSQEHLDELCHAHPMLPRDYLNGEFFPKMRDWCLDNRASPQHRKKFNARGRLKNPRSCLRNWLTREDPARVGDRYAMPARAPTDPRLAKVEADLAEGVVPRPGCPRCEGRGIIRGVGVCDCLHKPED